MGGERRAQGINIPPAFQTQYITSIAPSLKIPMLWNLNIITAVRDMVPIPGFLWAGILEYSTVQLSTLKKHLIRGL